MRSNDLEVMDAALRWAEEGWHCVLLTVLSTFGGSPRPPGSMAAISARGVIVGSVSGGCVEDDLIDEVRQGRFDARSPAVIIRTFGADAEEQARYRLPCNNTLRVAVETRWDTAVLREARDRVAQQLTVTRQVAFDNGQATLRAGALPAFFAEDAAGFEVTLGPRYRALLIGAAELGRYLAGLLSMLDFAVEVCDPRPEYADAWDLAHVPVSREMPDDWIVRREPDARTAVLAVSHDPKLDDLALLEALTSPAFYVGALGSRASTLKRKQRLLQLELEPHQVERLQGPVGLDIGSRTPAEIAVSVAAGLIHTLRRGSAPPLAARASPTPIRTEIEPAACGVAASSEARHDEECARNR